MTDEGKGLRWISYAYAKAADGDYRTAAFFFNTAGMSKEAKECWLKEAEGAVANGSYLRAGKCYEKLGETDKAKECWTKFIDYCFARMKRADAIRSCKEEGIPEDLICTVIKDRVEKADKEADSYINRREYGNAVYCYTKAGMTEQQAHERVANSAVTKKDYNEAINLYTQANLTLATLTKESQEQLLRFVREGNVTVTQGLAALVQTEEDEIIFNEARAGLVL
jgi:tetratricopeptide (TPR) repeat protein